MPIIKTRDNTYALATLVQALDLKNAIDDRFTGGGEVARYIGRNATKRAPDPCS